MSCAVHVVDTEKEKYTSLYIKWNDLNNENNKLKEQMEALQKELANARKLHSSQLDILDENKKLTEENKKLKEEHGENDKRVLFQFLQTLLDGPAGVGEDKEYILKVVRKILDENKKLTEEVVEKEKEVSLINYEEMENEEKIAELEQYNIFLKAECCAGGWAGRDNDIHQFADDVKGYFEEYKETHKIENVEELYKEWASDGWACIEDQLN